MKNRTEAQQKLWTYLYQLVSRTLNDAPGCHDFPHTLRVLNNARILLRTEPVDDPFAVEVAALLHDIARPEELASKGALCHAAEGAAKTASILRGYGSLPDSFITLVSECVRTHRYRGKAVPATPEARIVFDADKLDSVGAFGVARAFHFAGRIGACLHNTAEAALSSASYSHEDSAYREYLVKLRYLPEKMLTETGRKIAGERARFMHEFFERMNQEAYFPESDEI